MRAWILFLILSALCAGTYVLGLLPDTWRVQQMRDLALRLPEAAGLMPRTQREPRLELESEQAWFQAGYGYSLLRLRNEDDVALEVPAGRVHCTALDVEHRTIGSWRAGELGSLKPGQEITVRIGFPLRKGRLKSLDCRLVE
jgi:hypothetical protein